MPPIEPPTTQNSVSMPSRSISMVCARTMSGMVMTGKSSPHTLPVAGLIEAGPVEPMQPPITLRADDEVAVGVERPAGTDHGFPPAGLAGDRMHIVDMLIAGQRMADQDGVGAIRIQFAIGLIGDLERRQIDAAIELQRLVDAELRHQRSRMIRLMGAILGCGSPGWVSDCTFVISAPTSSRRLSEQKSGHKKTRPEHKVRPGSILSPACLASCLTWLQAGRLK